MGIAKMPEMSDQEMERLYEQFCSERPPAVRDVARRFRPWLKYRIKQTGQICRVYSFSEPLEGGGPITLKVNVLPEDNLGKFVLTGVQVFGVDPDDLDAVQ